MFYCLYSHTHKHVKMHLSTHTIQRGGEKKEYVGMCERETELRERERERGEETDRQTNRQRALMLMCCLLLSGLIVGQTYSHRKKANYIIKNPSLKLLYTAGWMLRINTRTTRQPILSMYQ